jgi:hypothetical protein
MDFPAISGANAMSPLQYWQLHFNSLRIIFLSDCGRSGLPQIIGPGERGGGSL